jgi:uridine kinase
MQHESSSPILRWGMNMSRERSLSSDDIRRTLSSSPTKNNTTNLVGATQPFIIGVTGGSASGKTTVCHSILKSLSADTKRVAIVSQDSFYRNLTQQENELAFQSNFNFDHPNAFDYEAFEHTVHLLKNGKSNVQVPLYDFKTNSRLVDQYDIITRADVIIVEGILIFYSKTLRDIMDMKIFVDTDTDTALARRIRRDITQRGRDLEGVLRQYETFVKPSYDEFIYPSKKYADIIVPRGGNEVAVDLLVQHVKVKLASMQ